MTTAYFVAKIEEIDILFSLCNRVLHLGDILNDRVIGEIEQLHGHGIGTYDLGDE